MLGNSLVRHTFSVNKQAVQLTLTISMIGANQTVNILLSLPTLLQMRITYDDQCLITVSEDGVLMIWKISDKEGRGLKRDKEVGYAEEILITKSDLEEKVSTSGNVEMFLLP